MDGKTVINCQHGPDECYGNKLHACAIDIVKNETASEYYNTCMMAANWGGAGSTDEDATNVKPLFYYLFLTFVNKRFNTIPTVLPI